MARTKQNAKRSTGGKRSKKQLAQVAARLSAPMPQHRLSGKAYRVWNICDRRQINSVLHYRVRWFGDWDDTWEPKTSLIKQGFKDDIEVVDNWKASKVPDFYDYCDKHEIAVGANEDGCCVSQYLLRHY
jgi:hypothetical protein